MYDESNVLALASKYQDAAAAQDAAQARLDKAEEELDAAQGALNQAKIAARRAADELLCAVNGETPRHIQYTRIVPVGCGEPTAAG